MSSPQRLFRIKQISGCITWVPGYLSAVEELADVFKAGGVESKYPLQILASTHKKHQHSCSEQGTTAAGDILVQNICSPHGLHHQSEQVAQPELVVLQTIGSDLVLSPRGEPTAAMPRMP